MVRLAMPREDEAHIKVPGIYNRQGRVNLSTDVVVVDMNGRFIRGYDAKAMSKEKYETEVKRERAAERGHVHYLDKGSRQIELRFVDDYPNRGAIDLSRMLVDRWAA